MSLVLIIGIAVFCFVLLYFSNSLAVEHTLLKILAYFFIVAALVVLGKALVDSGETCELVLSNSTEFYVYGINLTDYHYDDYGVPADFQHEIDYAKDALIFHINTTNEYSTVCYSNNTNNTAQIVYNLFLGFVLIFFTYIFIYFSYKVIHWAGTTFKKR